MWYTDDEIKFEEAIIKRGRLWFNVAVTISFMIAAISAMVLWYDYGYTTKGKGNFSAFPAWLIQATWPAEEKISATRTVMANPPDDEFNTALFIQDLERLAELKKISSWGLDITFQRQVHFFLLFLPLIVLAGTFWMALKSDLEKEASSRLPCISYEFQRMRSRLNPKKNPLQFSKNPIPLHKIPMEQWPSLPEPRPDRSVIMLLYHLIRQKLTGRTTSAYRAMESASASLEVAPANSAANQATSETDLLTSNPVIEPKSK